MNEYIHLKKNRIPVCKTGLSVLLVCVFVGLLVCVIISSCYLDEFVEEVDLEIRSTIQLSMNSLVHWLL